MWCPVWSKRRLGGAIFYSDLSFASHYFNLDLLLKLCSFFTRCNADDVISIRKLGTQRCAQMGSLQRTYVAISNNRRNNNNWDMDLCSILMVRHFQTLQILWPLTFLISMQWECFSIQWSLNSYFICSLFDEFYI